MKLNNWLLIVAACLVLFLVYMSGHKAGYMVEKNSAESKLREKELAFQKEKEATRLRIYEKEKQAEEEHRRETLEKDSKNTPEYLTGYNAGYQYGCSIFTMHPLKNRINMADVEKMLRATTNINSSDYQRGYTNGIRASIAEIENGLKAVGVADYSEYLFDYYNGCKKGYDDYKVCINSSQNLEELGAKFEEVCRNKSFGYQMGYKYGLDLYGEIYKKRLEAEKEAILRSNQLRRELLRETFRGD